jgi:hypothetical protein
VTANCDDEAGDTVDGDEVVVGGGIVVATAAGLGEIAVTSSFPSDDDTWSASASEDNDGDVGNWSLQAFALCMDAPAA